MISQLDDFLGILQDGQQMSVGELWGTTIVFTGQGNGGGYDASTGPLATKSEMQSNGAILTVYVKSFRVSRGSLESDGVVLEPMKTRVVETGTAFRLESIDDIASDPCLRLICKQV